MPGSTKGGEEIAAFVIRASNYPLIRVADVAACAERAFEVAELATVRTESLLVVRELAVVAKARWLFVSDVAEVIVLPLRVVKGGAHGSR